MQLNHCIFYKSIYCIKSKIQRIMKKLMFTVLFVIIAALSVPTFAAGEVSKDKDRKSVV